MEAQDDPTEPLPLMQVVRHVNDPRLTLVTLRTAIAEEKIEVFEHDGKRAVKVADARELIKGKRFPDAPEEGEQEEEGEKSEVELAHEDTQPHPRLDLEPPAEPEAPATEAQVPAAEPSAEAEEVAKAKKPLVVKGKS